HDIIFQHDSPAERGFNAAVIVAILLSVAVVMLDSVASVHARWGRELFVAEWTLTIAFTLEYAARIWSARDRRRYARSLYGVLDLLAVLPTYLGVFFPEGRFLMVFRVLRVLRAFRILKLAEYVQQAGVLSAALRASRYKITVFVTAVLSIVVVVGSLMYLIEGPEHGFTSIPTAVYWAIVTLTTVGYGDLAPATPLGKSLASALMILGYGVIAVPTGIVTLELDRAARVPTKPRPCPGCGVAKHDVDAAFCKFCGTQL
ncbi:MAG TPA: ion transporter, partial [Gemmatimonadaceae bacterium]|nr:ion transporter [Gemmatimonadaceae bacterium]